MDIPPVLLGCMSAFLTDRPQTVRVDGILSERKQLRWGISQGTKNKELCTLT